MTPEEEIRKLADEIYQAGSDWLSKAKAVTDAIPFVHKTVQYSQQFSQSFLAAPPNSDVSGWQPVRAALGQTQVLLASDQFKAMDGALSAAISGAAIISAAGSHATSLVANATRSLDPTVQSWAAQTLNGFEYLQTSDDNTAFIKKKLAVLYPGSESEFEVARNEYFKTAANATAPSSAAIAMRNVLESLNGNFLQLARQHSKGPIKNWTDAAAVVARGAPASVQTSQLVLQKSIYDDLHDMKLTKIAKNDWQPTKPEWEALFAQFVGFLFTVLGLIDFRDGS